MAERRMFAKTIVLSDAFLDMPLGSRCLYMTLGMVADDDGFVNSPRAIMRQCGATEDDMKVLLAKKFVLLFDDGVIVIKHWRINNYLRSDRYSETKYLEDKALLKVDENGAYSMPDSVGIPPGIPKAVYPDKDSIDKDSIDKINTIVHQDERVTSKTDAFEQEFEVIWKRYPRKQGKTNALKAYIKARKSGCTAEMISNGLDAYLTYIKIERVNPQYIKMGSTWFNQACWTDDYSTNRKPTTKDIAQAMNFEDF